MTNLPVLPIRAVESFNTFASTIQSSAEFDLSLTIGGTSHFQQSMREIPKRAIEAINCALTKEERIEALTAALRTFSHKDVGLHDLEIHLGADKVLCLKLGYVATTSFGHEEIELIGKCFLQVYQCSAEQRKRSFRSIGATELAPLLVRILMAGMLSMKTRLLEGDTRVLVTVVEVLRIYAKLGSAKSMLIRLNKGKWLGIVLAFCVNKIVSVGCFTDALSIELLGLIKDLIFRSSPADKMVVLSIQNGMFGALLASVCTNVKEIDSHTMEWFTSVFWNMVLEKTTCDQIMQSERHHDFPMSRLLVWVLSGDTLHHSQTGSYLAKIRRNAISSLGNILAHAENQKMLLSDQTTDKLFVISTIMKLAESDKDLVVRRRAMRAFHCVISSGTELIECIAMKTDLGHFLTEMITKNISIDDENDRECQIQTCLTISALTEFLEGGDWPRIETALVHRIETTNDESLIQAACATLALCIKKSPWRRGFSCFSDMFWARVEAVSTSNGTHYAIASLLLQLATVEKEERLDTSKHQPSVLTCAPVVNTLTKLISTETEDQEESRKHALETVVILVENPANKRPLAENQCLLSGLVSLCLCELSEKYKAIAKQAILDLVPEL